GAAYRAPDGTWEGPAEAPGWLPRAKALVVETHQRTPGSLVEEKSVSVVWHYRLVEPRLAAERLAELQQAVQESRRDELVEVLEGKMFLEIRPQGVSKALVVQRVMTELPPPSAANPLARNVVAIGDDRTDEQMFAALPSSGAGVHVGEGTSCAEYR